jgi:hypothetical protein
MRVGRSAVGVLLCGFAASEARAHGVVGQRSFIEPFVAEDVNPKNEFVIARPQWTEGREGRTFTLGFGLEKKLADRFSITLDSAWLDVGPQAADEPHESGFDNLGVTLKYAFFSNPEHEAITSIALESTAPTGSRDVGAEPDWSFKPFFLYGKGFGDLPTVLGYLRPLALQGDAGFEVSTDHDRTTTLAHDVAIEYSVPYLQSFVRDFGLGWPLRNLIADTEFNFEHGVHGEEQGKVASFVTSGIVYMDRWVEVGLAGRFPLNARARDEFDWGIIGIVDLFIDDIFPWTRWEPFGGMRPPTPPAGGGAS